MTSNAEPSPELEPTSPSTAVTTPEQSPNNDDDIWASDDQHEHSTTTRTTQHELLSDLPTIKRQHMTDGYREGLAVGKAKVMQQGFDAGYPIGTQIGLRAGVVLGILEAYLASKSMSADLERKMGLQKVYNRAKEELSSVALLRDMSDEVVAEATSIPESIEKVILKWEHAVVGTEESEA